MSTIKFKFQISSKLKLKINPSKTSKTKSKQTFLTLFTLFPRSHSLKNFFLWLEFALCIFWRSSVVSLQSATAAPLAWVVSRRNYFVSTVRKVLELIDDACSVCRGHIGAVFQHNLFILLIVRAR